MKRLALAFSTVIVLLVIAAAGCAEKEAGLTPGDKTEVLSSCVTCHTDKDTLKEVAAPEPVGEKSEATSGEG